jgi:mannose-6-phosphate isomerase-like protein (cupin superfamily)
VSWESWPDEVRAKRGNVLWQTLAQGEGLTLGVAKLAPGERLHEHRHEQAEVYYVLEGTGEVTIDGTKSPVEVDTPVFIPGNAVHGIRNTGSHELRFVYALAASSFADVEYVF